MNTIIPEKLYKQILRVMPIACVDLLISNSKGQVLLVKRKHEPAKGQWWFPGGRVHFGETRINAAKRKLKEECGLEAKMIEEIGAFDVILSLPNNTISHGITTVFKIYVENSEVLLDRHSGMYAWEKAKTWKKEIKDSFIITVMDKLEEV